MWERDISGQAIQNYALNKWATQRSIDRVMNKQIELGENNDKLASLALLSEWK